jgi:hypothetical protein
LVQGADVSDQFRLLQFQRNRASRLDWDGFWEHREQVTSRIVSAGRRYRQPALTILGAGNCNDICLRTCLNQYRSIALVDLDEEAMHGAMERQQVVSDQVKVYGNIDLTGCVDAMSDVTSEGYVRESTAGDACRFETLAKHARAIGPCEVVASTCLLSQLIETVTTRLGGKPEQQTSAAVAIRQRHLQDMMSLTSTGGMGVLITDFVSSDTAPELLRVEPLDVAGFAAECIQRGNFFTGTNPHAIRRELTSGGAGFPAHATVSAPWIWKLGCRVYLVASVEFQAMISSTTVP